MKNIIGIFLLLMTFTLNAQTDLPKIKEVKYTVSSVCNMCKKRIEKELNYTKGIIFAEVYLDQGQVNVKYRTKHLNADEIRDILRNLGYTTDGFPANEEAFEALPKCCKEEGCGK